MAPSLSLFIPLAGCVVAINKPHIVFVLVDDWGWNNVGFHRPNDPEVSTPNVDALVREGMELDRHYTYHYCSPTRSSLQSGRLPVHVSYTNEAPTDINLKDLEGGFMGIPRHMTGLAEKMREGGYRTHATGKWDAGMATWDHTPMGRGYESWFGYYHHANDYWTQRISANGPSGCPGELVDLWNTTGPAHGLNGTAYEEALFTENTLGVLDRHNTSEPLFLFHAFHQIHAPLQVPDVWEQAFSFLKDEDRRKYAAMVAYMDDALGKIVAKLKTRAMWDNTLMVVSSDNGGPIYYIPKIGYGGASNLPLRGGKLSDWEGGIRVNALVTGGRVPLEKRGSKLPDYIHVSDWYTTFCHIAGVDSFDHRAAEHGLPPVDGVDQSQLILGRAVFGSGNRTEIHHSVGALTVGRWKLVVSGLMDYFPESVPGSEHISRYGLPIIPWSDHAKGGWGREAIKNDFSIKTCIGGCLHDVLTDPEERHDVAWRHPQVVLKLKRRLRELNEGVYLPKRSGGDHSQACAIWNGYYGPWIDVPSKFLPEKVDVLV